jgi:hypothetical protein
MRAGGDRAKDGVQDAPTASTMAASIGAQRDAW